MSVWPTQPTQSSGACVQIASAEPADFSKRCADSKRTPGVSDRRNQAAKVSAFVKTNPEVAVFVAGDRSADYDTVYQAMVLLQQAGVERVGLMSNSAD